MVTVQLKYTINVPALLGVIASIERRMFKLSLYQETVEETRIDPTKPLANYQEKLTPAQLKKAKRVTDEVWRRITTEYRTEKVEQ